jgi:hypothetical protein
MTAKNSAGAGRYSSPAGDEHGSEPALTPNVAPSSTDFKAQGADAVNTAPPLAALMDTAQQLRAEKAEHTKRQDEAAARVDEALVAAGVVAAPEAPQPDSKKAAAFLRRRVEIDGVSPLLLSASWTCPETGERMSYRAGKVLTPAELEEEKRTNKSLSFESHNFGPKPDDDAVARWIDERQGKANLYYSDCVLRADYTAHKKARSLTDAHGNPGDVHAVPMLHGDIDPRVGETPEECVERVKKALQHSKLPRPSHAVATGGGVQPFWLQEEPLPIECKDERAERAKLYNKPLAAELGGDMSACNVDHIMRIPCTINIPNKRKREKGRTQLTVSHVLWDEGTRYPRDKFRVADDPNAETESAKASGKVSTTRNGSVATVITAVPQVESLDDPRIGMMSAEAKRIMEHGLDPEVPDDTKSSGRSSWSFYFCCLCYREGVPEDVQFTILTDPRWKISASILDKPKPSRQALRDIENAKKAERLSAQQVAESTIPRKEVLLRLMDITPMLDEIQQAMVEAAAPIYQQAGRLVHIYKQERADPEGAEIRRDAGALTVKAIAKERLVEYIGNYLTLYKLDDDNKAVPVPVSPKIANHIRKRPDKWTGIRVLEGIVECPTLRRNGTLLIDDGYDAATGLYLDKGGVEYVINEKATLAHAQEALKYLRTEVANEFPFVSDNPNVPPGDDRAYGASSKAMSVLLSWWLTCLTKRSLMRGAPMHGMDANSIATGKSVASSSGGWIALGRDPTILQLPWDETEAQKVMLTVLRDSDQVVVFDNADRPVGGSTLNTVITQEKAGGRLLGVNENEQHRTTMALGVNGNNLQFFGDMISRAVTSRMNVGMEKPDERVFKKDLKEYVLANRPRIVAALLTIMLAYYNADRPFDATRIKPSRFYDWDHTVRGALIWAGEPDPNDTRADVAALDPVSAERAALIDALAKCFGVGSEKMVTAADVGRLLEEASKSVCWDYNAKALLALLRPHMPKAISTNAVARVLGKHVDTLVNGRCIRRKSINGTGHFYVDSGTGVAAEPEKVERPPGYEASDPQTGLFQRDWKVPPHLQNGKQQESPND